MTTRSQLPPRYDAGAIEPAVYERWLASGGFAPAEEPPAGARRFVITMPPPNVTGALHIGHALTFALEDTMIRYHRMRGDDTLWVPGVDHASIGAQFVLDKLLAAEGESRASLGRERYLERMWQFMDATRGVIALQLRRLGASADWNRSHFTMDEQSARAVRVAFRRLWDAGFVYRGEALITWCPRCLTTISDLETIHREEEGRIWTIRYHLADDEGRPQPDRWIAVATTRPETLLGDVAVAVHPDDPRYAELVGREAILPFLGRRLPIIADEAVEREFGTGAVKITPAHDPNDYAMARRHGLPMINIFEPQARVNENGGEFAGLDRYEARERLLERLREMGDLEAERPHRMMVAHCERCGTVVEPRLSVQWFVRVKPLAERALASVREDRTEIIPPHFEKVYAHWMENIIDWAVGRQLWWGHRIPAWYCPDGHITVSDEADGPDACVECGRPASELTQESDIFDTWFSSALWPFSTLGWPDETPDMARFYPTTVMETGYDILFFWVARMMMMGLFCTDTEPFRIVYLHGLVRAAGGVKMSKTKGNVVDPLELVDEIGADALRFALTIGTSPGHDQRLTRAKIEGARNFANKLWNVARFVLGAQPDDEAAAAGDASLPERWIRSRLAELVERTTGQLEALDLAGYAAAVQEFAWSDYADWFVEMAKVELRREEIAPGERRRVWETLAATLGELLRLLHPLMPFITEEVWTTLHAAWPGATGGEALLMTAAWPKPGERDAAAEAEVGHWIAVIRALRNQRTELGIPAAERRAAVYLAASTADAELVRRGAHQIERLAQLSGLAVPEPGSGIEPPGHASAFGGGSVFVREATEDARVAERRERQRQELQEQVARLEALLANGSFTERAPAAVVEKERKRLAEFRAQLGQLGD
ncbi:MAG TPA: valine--tRNA ligase [Candidatus Limnocylindria bacterium]|nr:valine--tRNA ligase [Candidatus Limnocylindria bacterium]